MDIKIGEYVRTTDGIIEKVVKIGKIRYIHEDCYQTDRKETLYIEDIKSHSKNLINLIEIGDFVNGFLIDYMCLNYKIPFIRSERPYREDTGSYATLIEKGKHYNQPLNFINSDIKSVLTKEQYKRNCYKVEV